MSFLFPSCVSAAREQCSALQLRSLSRTSHHVDSREINCSPLLGALVEENKKEYRILLSPAGPPPLFVWPPSRSLRESLCLGLRGDTVFLLSQKGTSYALRLDLPLLLVNRQYDAARRKLLRFCAENGLEGAAVPRPFSRLGGAEAHIDVHCVVVFDGGDDRGDKLEQHQHSQVVPEEDTQTCTQGRSCSLLLARTPKETPALSQTKGKTHHHPPIHLPRLYTVRPPVVNDFPHDLGVSENDPAAATGLLARGREALGFAAREFQRASHLQGWIDAVGMPVTGWGSTVTVFDT